MTRYILCRVCRTPYCSAHPREVVPEPDVASIGDIGPGESVELVCDVDDEGVPVMSTAKIVARRPGVS